MICRFVDGPQDGREVPWDADQELPESVSLFKSARQIPRGVVHDGHLWPLGGEEKRYDLYVLATDKGCPAPLFKYGGEKVERIGAEPVDQG